MLKRTIPLIILFISSVSVSLRAMQGPTRPGRQTSQMVLRKSGSQPNLQTTSITSDDNGESQQHAFEQNFPPSTILRSKYIKDATSEDQLINALINMPWIKEKQEDSTEVRHILDARDAEEIFRREILLIERPKILKEIRGNATKNPSFIQQNPTINMLVTLAIGASLTLIVQQLIKNTEQ